MNALQHTRASLENSFKNDCNALKVIRPQILLRPTNANIKSISTIIKEGDALFVSANNGFGTPYYLKIGKETLLVSVHGRITTPEFSLGDILLKIKNQKPEESLYVDKDAFYLALKVDQGSYLILKRPREVGDRKVWHSES